MKPSAGHLHTLVKFDYLEASDAEVGLSYRNNGIWKGEVSFVDLKSQIKYLLITASSVYDEKGATNWIYKCCSRYKRPQTSGAATCNKVSYSTKLDR